MSPLLWSTSDDRSQLTARPSAAGYPSAAPKPGIRRLELGGGPEVLVRVPAAPDGTVAPYRLMLTLHGAGGNAQGGLAPLLPLADAHRLLLVAPTSQQRTWDLISQGQWGSDVRRIDQALTELFATYPVHRSPLAISGFSDGASYALSLGLANADLFTHIIAFSPGFLVAFTRPGTPRVYISHGRADTVLPIDQTTRRIVPRLQAAHVPTEVHEFDGPHTVPADISADAVRWLSSP